MSGKGRDGSSLSWPSGDLSTSVLFRLHVYKMEASVGTGQQHLPSNGDV